MPYWQLFYHLVWATKNREPLLRPPAEKEIFGYLTGKATALGGVVYTLGGIVDHVHMVVAIPPAIAVAKFVGQIKGVASTRLNQSGASSGRFEWQDEYGAFSFDAKRLPNFITYVNHQKEHHATGTAIPILERMASDNVGPELLREQGAVYAIDETGWREELINLG